jgi:hypothetical protein
LAVDIIRIIGCRRHLHQLAVDVCINWLSTSSASIEPATTFDFNDATFNVMGLGTMAYAERES